MRKITAWASGAGFGAALMYFLDPQSGALRRAQVRDRAVSLGSDVDWWAGKTFRDAETRLRGVGADLVANVRHRGAPDRMLRERVRSRLGRYSSHPRSILVEVTDGRVALAGPVLKAEVADLLRAVESVRGVLQVDNRLDVHDTADTPALQGGTPVTGAQADWTPALRTLVGAGASILAFNGVRRGGRIGLPMALAGAGLLARAIAPTNGARRRRRSYE